jgi:NitT/TauT family transport system substrate-binding protein
MTDRARVAVGYYYPWTNDAGIFQAREKGYFQEEGLDVDITAPDHGHGDTLRYLADGDVDFGIFPHNRLLVYRENEPNVVGIAAINQRGLETIQTVKGKGIETPAELSGKTIALNPTARGLAMVKQIIKANGGDPDALKYVHSGTGELSAKEIKETTDYDATFGSYWAWDILLDESLPDEERIYWPVDEIGAPRYHSYILGTTAAHAERDPDYVRHFVRAAGRGYTDLVKDPQVGEALFRKYTPYLSPRAVARSLPLIADTWLLDGVWGTQREDYYREYSDWLFDNDILKDRDGWQSSFTNEFLPR